MLDSRLSRRYASAHDDGDGLRRLLRSTGRRKPVRDEDVDFEPHQFVGVLRDSFVAARCLAALDDNGLTFDVAECA